MNICSKCQAAFEGKFCPECGTKYEMQVCSRCGATLPAAVKFCPECGQPVAAVASGGEQTVTTETPETKPSAADKITFEPDEKKPIFTPALLEKIYAALRYVPAAIFALYTVLMFAFFGGSAAKFGGASIGNVYSRGNLREIGGLNGTLTCLVVLFFISLALTVALAVVLCVPRFKGRATRMFGKYLLREEQLSYATFVMYLLFLISSAVGIGQVSHFDGGLKLVKAGGGLGCILGFAIAFAALSCAALVGRRLLDRYHPQIGMSAQTAREQAIAEKRETDRKRAAVYAERVAQRDAARAEIAAKQVERTLEESAVATQPAGSHDVATQPTKAAAPTQDAFSVDPQKPQSFAPVLLGGKPVLALAHEAVKMRRALTAFGICLQIFAGVIFLFGMSEMGRFFTLSKNSMFVILVSVFGFIFALSILMWFLPVRNWTPDKLQPPTQLGWKRNLSIHSVNYLQSLFALPPAAVAGAIIVPLLIGLGLSNSKPLILASVPMYVAAGIVVLASIAGMLQASVCGKKFALLTDYYYNGKYGVPVPFDYERENAYLTNYKHGRMVTVDAQTIGKPPRAVVRSILANLFFDSVIVCIVLFQIVLSPFNRLYVSALPVMGHAVTAENVTTLYGKPDEIITSDNSDEQSKIYGYYSGDYKKAVKRMTELAEELEVAEMQGDGDRFAALLIEIAKLREDMLDMRHKCMMIAVDGNNKVTAVAIDTRRKLSELSKTKSVEKVELVGKNGNVVLRGAATTDKVAKYYYGDGSYKCAAVPYSAYAAMFADTPETSEWGTARWQDEWGSYSANIHIANGVYGKWGDIRFQIMRPNANVSSYMLKFTGNGDFKNGKSYDSVSYPWEQFRSVVGMVVLDGTISANVNYDSDILGKEWTRLTDVVIGENVTDLSGLGLDDCPTLTDVWLESTQSTYWGSNVTVHEKGTWTFVNGVPRATV